MHTTQIEQQLTILLRRVAAHPLHAPPPARWSSTARRTASCAASSTRAPQRLGSLAQAFGLDPSTITRQVQALEQRRPRRAATRTRPTAARRSLDLTDEGRQRAHRDPRARRRAWLGRRSTTGPSTTTRSSAGCWRSSTCRSTSSCQTRPATGPADADRAQRCRCVSDFSPRSRCQARYAATSVLASRR